MFVGGGGYYNFFLAHYFFPCRLLLLDYLSNRTFRTLPFSAFYFTYFIREHKIFSLLLSIFLRIANCKNNNATHTMHYNVCIMVMCT